MMIRAYAALRHAAATRYFFFRCRLMPLARTMLLLPARYATLAIVCCCCLLFFHALRRRLR